MEKLYSVQDIMNRYQVTAQTARKYMRRMVHMEKQLMVSETSLRAYETGRTITPNQNTHRKESKSRPASNSIRESKTTPKKSTLKGPYFFERRRA